MDFKLPSNFVWASQEPGKPASLNVRHIEQQELSTGTVISIMQNGSLIVKFERIPFSKTGYNLEVFKENGGTLTSIGTGKSVMHSPGCYLLNPGPDGISNPSIGDTVKIS